MTKYKTSNVVLCYRTFDFMKLSKYFLTQQKLQKHLEPSRIQQLSTLIVVFDLSDFQYDILHQTVHFALFGHISLFAYFYFIFPSANGEILKSDNIYISI